MQYIFDKITRNVQCWTHTRRLFFEAQKIEPERAAHALDLIGKIYQVEAQIRERDLRGPAKRAWRVQHARPLVTQFFVWIGVQFDHQGLLPNDYIPRASRTSATSYP
ncbi:IS66 family transposase [Massilia scottii]|uniref:IS66 family transposase n=1 Tax=Massilia scottii TaxID=3057166 RepID=UPI0035B66906